MFVLSSGILSCDTQPAAARSTVHSPPISACAFTKQLRQAASGTPVLIPAIQEAVLSQQWLLKSSVPVGCGHVSQSRILVLQSFVSPGLLQY